VVPSNPWFNVLLFQYAWMLDDFYICDDTGGALNSYLGNIRCQALIPNGPGALAQFTSSTGGTPNWQAASNQNADDTAYVYSATVGQEDNYAVTPLVNTPNVLAVQSRVAAKQDDATQRFLESVLVSAGTEVNGASVALRQTDYAFQNDIFVTDPATGVGWLYPAVNSAKIGMKVSG
jgi:hypothetical protein